MKVKSLAVFILVGGLLGAALDLGVQWVYQEPKFHKNERVQVISGFYKGSSGIVIKIWDLPSLEYKYLVRFEDSSEFVREHNLAVKEEQ